MSFPSFPKGWLMNNGDRLTAVEMGWKTRMMKSHRRYEMKKKSGLKREWKFTEFAVKDNLVCIIYRSWNWCAEREQIFTLVINRVCRTKGKRELRGVGFLTAAHSRASRVRKVTRVKKENRKSAGMIFFFFFSMVFCPGQLSLENLVQRLRRITILSS